MPAEESDPESNQDMKSLVQQASRGDERAVASLLVQHLPSLEAYVRLKAGKMLRGREDCSDLVQSVCLEALRDMEGFEYRGETAFRHWLFIQAMSKIASKGRYYKAEKRDVAREIAADAAVSGGIDHLAKSYAGICTPSVVAMGREQVRRFEEAFEKLPEDQREAIALYRLVGLGYEEIATSMGRTVGAVRNLVYRGLARLTAELMN